MEATDADFWTRTRKSIGILGILAFLLVILASRVNGGFDWSVFMLSGGALILAWWQNVLLVPVHLRHQDAEDAYWKEFRESDWRFVECLSGLSGADWDALKALFESGDDPGVREFLKTRWPIFSDDERTEFIRFFKERMTDTVSAYIDETGRLRPFDDY